METNLHKQVRILRIGIITLILLNAFLILSAFAEKPRNGNFEEISVERLNIIGINQKPVMVLSNKRLIPGPSINGKSYPREFSDGRENLSGMIFFNEEGDEVGGLLYNGIARDSGYSAVGHFSLDQWKQNQVIAMQYLDNGKSRRAGLRVYDRPTNIAMDAIFDRYVLRNKLPRNSPAYDSISKEIKASGSRGDNGVERMFIGSQDEVAQIQLRDKNGKVKIKMYVDKDGEAKIDFLDGNGTVTKRFSN